MRWTQRRAHFGLPLQEMGMHGYIKVARGRVELPTCRLVIGYSIQLSYRAKGGAEPDRVGSGAPNHSPTPA